MKRHSQFFPCTLQLYLFFFIEGSIDMGCTLRYMDKKPEKLEFLFNDELSCRTNRRR